MNKVVKIYKGLMTHFTDILNTQTGTTDHVFDSSMMVDINSADFYFMEEGKVYDCKIQLFGEFVRDTDKYTVPITILHTHVMIGNTPHVQVAIGADVYYVLQSDALGLTLEKTMLYSFTRKDLIQVDDVVHADLL